MTKATSILDIPEHNLTPGMKQYRDAKKENPDCIILLRMGDFYEMFYEDAITTSKVLEITLTARGKGEKQAPLAGIPYHALEPYLGKLVKHGLKVAIVEQLEDPKLAKGLVKRGVVRIVTPGTVMDASMLSDKDNNYIMSLTCSNDAFAYAICDLSTGEFTAQKVENEISLLNEINKYNPSEIILPQSLEVNHQLLGKIQRTGSFVNAQNDYFFKFDRAKETILSHFKIISLDTFGLEDKKLHTQVSGALINFLITTQKNSLTHINQISVRSSQHKMLLDATTQRNLELFKNIKDGSLTGTLISVLDLTVTPMGSRLLKKWIKEPLLHLNSIAARHKALTELNDYVIIREELMELLAKIYDLERLIGRINYGNANPMDLVALRTSMQQIPLLKDKLTQMQCPLLSKLQDMDDLSDLTNMLSTAINEDPPHSLREGGIFKSGYNQELDNLHHVKKNSRKYLQDIEDAEKNNTGISTLKLGFTRVFGYFIEVTKKNIHLVPPNYIRKQTTANSERYITEQLKVEEEKILGAEEKINALEFKLFQEIINIITSNTKNIQEVAKKIATLDVLSALAKVSMECNYIKPEMVQSDILNIRGGRHPVVERIQKTYIPNDVIINSGEIMIITGSNMSGKSTVMRQTALICLMAQIGSFVPAEQAQIGICDRIFTRVGASDDLASGQSTFMLEMQETASILTNATSRSLIILDEIGRGTSTFDGVSIAWSVAEHIYNQIKARSLFATHYHVLNKMADKFAKITNYNMAVKEYHGDIVMLHKLLPGATDQSHGVHVARLAGLPPQVVQRAKEIQLALEKDDEMVRKIKAKKIEDQMGLTEF